MGAVRPVSPVCQKRSINGMSEIRYEFSELRHPGWHDSPFKWAMRSPNVGHVIHPEVVHLDICQVFNCLGALSRSVTFCSISRRRSSLSQRATQSIFIFLSSRRHFLTIWMSWSQCVLQGQVKKRIR